MQVRIEDSEKGVQEIFFEKRECKMCSSLLICSEKIIIFIKLHEEKEFFFALKKRESDTGQRFYAKVSSVGREG